MFELRLQTLIEAFYESIIENNPDNIKKLEKVLDEEIQWKKNKNVF